jgi:nitric oxide reductase large subunit
MTLLRSPRRTTTSLILFFGLFSAALLYLPGMIDTTNQTMDAYWRWWVVHLWVEGVWELIMGGLLSYLLIKLTGVDREVVEKWLYVIVGLTFLSGIWAPVITITLSGHRATGCGSVASSAPWSRSPSWVWPCMPSPW